MAWKEGTIVIFCSLLVHSFIFYENPQLTNTLGFVSTFFVLFNVILAATYLLFPFLGWLGDTYLTRYWVVLGGMFFVVMTTTIGLVMTGYDYFKPKHNDGRFFWLMVAPIYFLITLGIGIIQSNILQFTIDQTQGETLKSTQCLVRWYFWGLYFGQQIIYYALIILIIFRVFPIQDHNHLTYKQMGSGVLFVSCIVLFIFSIIVLFLLFCYSRRFNLSSADGHNSLAIFTKVFTYACKQRLLLWSQMEGSLFLDVGKRRHGGPFTVNEVESVKVSVQIFCIILTSIAFNLSGDTYSLGERIINIKGCPSLAALLTVGINPNHIPYLIPLLVIPLCQISQTIFKRPKLIMLKKIILGLVCVLLAIIVEMTIAAVFSNYENSTAALPNSSNNTISRLVHQCLLIRTNQSSTHFVNNTDSTDHVNNVFWLLIVPQLLKGIGYVLVAMVILEFICVQAPRESQGILIGTWYATYSISHVVALVGVVKAIIIGGKLWYVYKGVLAVVMIFLIVCFSSIVYNYQYRERDEFPEDTPLPSHVTCHVSKVTRVGRKGTRGIRSYGTIISN